MQMILTGFAARSLTHELAEQDARQLRDIGLCRALDGSLRLLDDPTLYAAPPVRRVKQARSWLRSWLGFMHPSRGLKTAL